MRHKLPLEEDALHLGLVVDAVDLDAAGVELRGDGVEEGAEFKSIEQTRTRRWTARDATRYLGIDVLALAGQKRTSTRAGCAEKVSMAGVVSKSPLSPIWPARQSSAKSRA